MDDWLSYLAGQPHEEEVDDGDEDFYGSDTNNNGDVRSGAMDIDDSTRPVDGKITGEQTKHEPATKSLEERKAENQRKADMLRAKLIAQRQNTPRQGTPVKAALVTDTPSRPSVVLQQGTGKGKAEEEHTNGAPSSDALGLESLLAEGRAAAEAKNVRLRPKPTVNGLQNGANVETQPHGNTKSVAQSTDINQAEQHSSPNNQATATTTDNSNKCATLLTDPYYADLSAWLDMTGYHDLDYRNKKMQKYKEKRALEDEAAVIAQKLAKLAEAERADIAQLRAFIAHPVKAEEVDAPQLPFVMPSEDVAKMAADLNRITNGVKRQHSPGPVPKPSKRRDASTGGFKIRGATNDPPDVRMGYNRQSPLSTDRRMSYPGGRRMSRDGPASRDPSLERRQAYYRRDSDVNAGYRRDEPGPRYGQYPPRDIHETPRPVNPRPGNTNYGSVGRAGGYRDFNQSYRGSAALDLRKGGVRYFMIKSWNHDNVLQSMRDGLWATQTKNEEILTEAYRTSRHVILLFSVNKSMAFQGYALMTSPPDPQLPKPSFCTKLNWSTSPAFTLRWLAKTAVHFRMIGHLKNTCNVDEVTGEPRAVLVGKDGQEISNDAGMGVAMVLDEADALERPADGGAAR